MTCADELPETISAAPSRCVAVTVFEAVTGLGREAVAVVSTVAAPPKPGVVGGLLGARKVHPAPAFVVNAVTDYAAGLVCPLLLPPGLTVLVDDRLKPDNQPIFLATGERHTALTMRAFDLLSLMSGKSMDLRVPRRRGSRQTVALRH